jgi:hypothetical protein
MFPSSGVAPYGRPSMGTNEDQEVGAPVAEKGGQPGPVDGSNPSIADSMNMFGNGPGVIGHRSSPYSDCEPGMPGAK